MTKNSDQHIIDRILNGDTNSFALLVDRYKNLVFILVFRMMKNREEAEEVAQDIFFKAFQSLKKFKGDSKFSTWIYRIGYNSCLDRLKKNKKEQQLVYVDEFTVHQIKSMNTVLDSIEIDERSRVIQDCIALLPNDESLLLTLFYFDELSLVEIAEIIGISPGNIKVKLFRTRKKLATILKRRLEPEIIESYEQRDHR